MKLSEAKVKVRVWTGVMEIVLFAGLGGLLFSCQNTPKQPMGLENMPEFEQKFPQKSVWLHHHTNDSTEITFSSMEEAEWKLVHFVPNCSYEDFEKILLSDPSSMDYPFDSLFRDDFFCGLCPSEVKSDDGNMRCFREFPPSGHAVPRMIVQYRVNDVVRVAEEGFPSDNCYYCIAPDTVYTYNTGKSILYLVVGYISYTGRGHCYGLMAYELDDTDFHPAFVFPADTTFADYLWEEHGLFTEICFNADTLSEKDLYYFDNNKSTLYVRNIENRENNDECGCTTMITDRFLKFVWNGKKFVCENIF